MGQLEIFRAFAYGCIGPAVRALAPDHAQIVVDSQIEALAVCRDREPVGQLHAVLQHIAGHSLVILRAVGDYVKKHCKRGGLFLLAGRNAEALREIRHFAATSRSRAYSR